MQIIIANVLAAADIDTIAAMLANARFVDGRATAGFAAQTVKQNTQAEGSDRSLVTAR